MISLPESPDGTLSMQESSLEDFFKKLTVASGLLTVMAGVLGITGNYFDITIISSVYPGYKTMALSAALIWIFLGAILALMTIKPFRQTTGVLVKAALVIITGAEAIELLLTLQGYHFIVESWFIGAGTAISGSPSPISPVAAALIISASVALFFSVGGFGRIPGNKRTRDAVSITGLVISIVSITFILSYFYGAPFLYGTPVIPIAAISALCASFVGAGLVAVAGPGATPARYFAGNSIRARLLRTFIPLIVIVVLVQGPAFQFLSSFSAVPNALLLSTILVIFSIGTVYVVAWVSRGLGDALDQAEQALLRKNEELSSLNEELTAIGEELRQNIKELTRKENDLRESKKRLNRSEEIAHLGSWELDPVSNHLTWSDEVYRIFGMRPQEFGATYEAFLDAVHPDDRAAVDTAYSGSLRDGKDVYEIGHRVVRRDTGEIRHVLEKCEHVRNGTGRAIRSVGMVQDITAFKAAEEALKRAHADLDNRVRERTAKLNAAVQSLKTERHRLYDVLETLPVYVCLLTPDYHMPFANRYFREAFGEPHGRCCYDFLFNRSEPCETCESYNVMNTRAPHHWYWTGPNGRDYDIYDFPFTDTDGSFLILEMGIDITERNKAQEALKKAHDNLEATVRERTAELVQTNISLRTEIEERRQVEEALRESENRLRQESEFLEAVTKGTEVIIAAVDTELRYTFFNNAYKDELKRLTGKEIALGMSIADVSAHMPGQQVISLKEWGRALAGESSSRTIESGDPHHHRMFSVHHTPLRDRDGKVTGAGEVAYDVTSQVKAEKELRVFHEWLGIAQKAANAGFWDWDINAGTLTWSDELYELFGLDPAVPASFDTWLSALHPDDRGPAMAKINNSINDHVPLENEYRVIRADGKERWIGVWGNSFYDEGGRPQRMSGICIDITERKHADSILHATSQYLENLINYANAPIVVWDPEFRITRFNYAFELLTGRDAKDVIGRHLELLFPEKYRETSMNLIRRTILGERLNVVEIPILRMDGEIRIVLWNSATLYEPDKTTIHSTIAQGQDITERKFAEENGRKTLSLLNAALESTADGILVVDLNGKITSYNQNFATMWNISEKLLNSSEDGTVLGPGLSQIKDPDGYLARIKELYAHPAGESYDMIEFSDGRIFERYSKPQKIGDTIIGRVWSFRDISDRRHAEEALRQSEEKFRIIATNTPDHILVQDRDLRYIQVINPQLGLNEGDMTGKTDHDILSKEDAEKLTEVKKRVLDTGKPLFLELPLVTRAGDINYFEGSFIPKLNKAGQVDGIIGYFRNVTERKLAEEKIISALREKETLIREVHHRVKNNLQVISGLLDMTRMRTSDESTGSILTDMMMKIQTMAQIHTRLYESKQFDRINMEGQIRDQIAAMTNIYSVKDRQIAYEINSDEIYLPVDQAIPCALVVNEILSNIFKHAFKGRRRGNIDITMMQDDGNVRLIIRDDGIGMPEGFDISRTNSLGIKLIRTLTQHQLNGSLMVSSQHGTEVIVEFPIRKTET